MSTEMSAASQTYRFTLGSFECVSLSDGEMAYPIEKLFSNVARETVIEALERRNLPADHVITPYTCLYINTGDHQVLVDMGAGPLAPTTGTLAQSLVAAKIESDAIDTVIITHAHPDHIGGSLNLDGSLLCPNARYFIWKGEWDFWHSEAARTKLQRFMPFIDKNLDPVQDRMVFLSHEQEIVAGIQAIATPGHTPGHMALSIHSGHEQLLHVADTVLHPLHLEHPDWVPTFDLLPDQASVSKQRIFERAVAENALVFAHHFPPFPNLGYVAKKVSAWHWRPVLGAS